jgi:hypothetical protein
MNAKERETIKELSEKINLLDKKVQGISDALLDDERTSRIGVISEVEQIRKDINSIMSVYRIVKWVVISVGSIALALMGNYVTTY